MEEKWKYLAEATWPSQMMKRSGDFVLRDNMGQGGSRANSAQAMTAHPKIDETIARYIIWPSDKQLAQKLEQLGYVDDDHATVFLKSLSAGETTSTCQYMSDISEELKDFYLLNDVDQSRVDIMSRAQTNKIFVVQRTSGRITGAMYGGYEGGRAWIYGLVVAPLERQKGNARQIMQSICAELAQKGVSQVALSVLPTNLPAIKLYQSLGFIEVSRYYFLERSEELCG